MSAPDAAGAESVFKRSCRILTVSASLPQAISFINRVQKLGASQSTTLPTDTPDPPLPVSDRPGFSSSINIPWTISNRYYSADVHFAAHTIQGLSPHEVQNIPAVIFVWAQGEPYKHHVERISQDLNGCEPEVSLAVRIRREVSLPITETEEELEDNSEIDGFLSSHRFEYIDATEEQTPRLPGDTEVFAEGIPHLPRVLDALSTIMWPSMQTQLGDATQKKQDVGHKGRSVLDWAQGSQGHSFSDIEEVLTGSRNQSLHGTRGRAQEMQELARWLEGDESLREDPWKTAADSGAITMSPSAVEHTGVAERSGFDDDFTVFISAPAVDPTAEESGRSTPDMSIEDPTAMLQPPHAGDLYRSLGSVSDFGGSDDGKETDEKTKDDVEDADLPSQEEIQAVSARIFGKGVLPQPPILDSQAPTMKPTSLSSSEHWPYPQTPPKPISETFPFDSLSSQTDTIEEVDESYDMAPFDLSRVFSALQGMKAEIASMEDEGERRKAAAKVALGLVYGLEADAGVYNLPEV